MSGWLLACSARVSGVVALAALYVFLVRPWHLRWGATDGKFRGEPGPRLRDSGYNN
ncbi:MAG TPA: hypothetical protein VKA46_06085 [Gemmataceae bacterium]|nr:hypothetical protein [Gemmataceae bacterium]